jgi:hypothetical protein
MGLLDNSANTITVDAIITDTGREFLARNDGRFEIVRYSFGDDEINYGLFNPNTGSLQQDNNILNTPLFEASVNETIALKYQLLSISNPDLKYLPSLQGNVSALALGERTDSQTGKTLSFSQVTQAGRTVPSEIVDASFVVQLNNDLLYMQNQVPVNLTPYGIGQYVIPRSALAANQGAQVNFAVGVQSLPNDLWATLGKGAVGSRSITTKVRCAGALSGLSADVTITINEEFVRTS